MTLTSGAYFWGHFNVFFHFPPSQINPVILGGNDSTSGPGTPPSRSARISQNIAHTASTSGLSVCVMDCLDAPVPPPVSASSAPAPSPTSTPGKNESQGALSTQTTNPAVSAGTTDSLGVSSSALDS